MAAVRTPTANVFRAVALATAAVLLATSCGGTSSHYVSNKSAQTYFKVPKDWDVANLQPDRFPFLINDNIWAVFFAPTGLHPDALDAPDKSPAPLGVVVVGQLEQNSYDSVNDLNLRIIPYTDAAGEAQYIDPLTLRTTQDDDIVRLVGMARITNDGLRGYRMRYEVTSNGMPPMMIDQTTLIHDATHTYYQFSVTCTTPCFANYVGDINTILDSLRVRRDQP